MYKTTLATMIVSLSWLSATSTMAEEFRLPPLTWFVFSAEVSLDARHGRGIAEHVDRLPAELSFVFQAERPVLFRHDHRDICRQAEVRPDRIPVIDTPEAPRRGALPVRRVRF